MKNIQKTRLFVQLTTIVFIIVGLITLPQAFKVLLLLVTVLGGAYYCGWLCPFGALQDLMSLLGDKLKIKKRKMPKSVHNILIYARYILFILLTLLSLDIIFTLAGYDPRNNFIALLNGHTLSITTACVIVFFLGIGIFFDRPFCNYLCPEGAKYGLISSIRLFTIRRNANTCIQCKKCDNVCPMHIDISNKDQVNSLQCVNCFKCISACPINQTLTYKRVGFTKYVKIRYLITVAVAIIGLLVFLITGKVSNNNTGTAPVGTVTEITITGVSDTSSSTSTIADSASEAPDTTVTAQTSEAPVTTVTEQTTEPPLTTVTAQTSEAPVTTVTAQTSEAPVTTVTAQTTEPPVTTVTAQTTESPVTTVVEQTTEAPVTTTSIDTTISNSAFQLNDGVYTGVGEGYKGPITVNVTIKQGEIVNIEVTDHSDDRKWFNRAYMNIPTQIINNQSTDVDVISGATYSSQGIISAVRNALQQ